MATVTVSNHVAAPVSRSLCFTDIKHGPQHVGGIKKVEMLTPGVVHLGSQWRETREVLGRDDSAEINHRLRAEPDVDHTTRPASGSTNVLVPARGRGTVSVDELDGGGVPPGLLAPLGWAIEGKVERVLSNDLLDIKHSVES
jgi:hypothetical protein